MSYYQSQIERDLQRSRKYAVQKQLEIRRSRRLEQEIIEQDLRQIATAEKIRADRQYEEFLLRRQSQQRELQSELIRERAIRQSRLQQQQVIMQVQRRSRIIRQQELYQNKLLQDQQQRRKAELLAASRRVQLQSKQKILEQQTRQNLAIKQEQLQQQRIQSELKQIDINIGTIYDQREQRRKNQLLELQALDQSIFKVRQQMRGSKVKITAHEESLNDLAKIIGGAR